MADADERSLLDNPDARDLADIRSAISEGFFSRIYHAAANFAADPANADALSANLPWVALGPRNVGGRIRCIAQDPINTATLYAGSAFGGLWKTENRGDTWRPIGFFLPAFPAREISPPIGAIGICHRTPTTVYVGTGEPVPSKPSGIGLYRTIDGGLNIPGTRPRRAAAARSAPTVMTASWSTHGITIAPGRPANSVYGAQAVHHPP